MGHLQTGSALMKSAVLGGTLALACATGAHAATFRRLEFGTATLLGLFEAPALGGALTSLSATIGGVTYDTLSGGVNAPVYSAATNDLSGAGAELGYVSNSAAAGICGAGECAFSFYAAFHFDTPTPGQWYTDRVFVPPTERQSLGYGYYEVAAIPAPLGALLLASALLGFAGLRSRKPA